MTPTQAGPLLLCGLAIAAALAPAPARPEEPATPAGEPTAAPEAPPPPPEGLKRALYLPEAARARLKDDLKEEVLTQARREGWATPGVVPAWLRRLTLSGDVRVRLERDLPGSGNANSGEFPDFNAINAGQPFDVNFVDTASERYLNVDQRRTRPRLRARLALDYDLGQGFFSGVRLASGDGSTPISTNQTLGGSGGNFSKYQLWLDRAYLRYAPLLELITLSVGRFDNPFLHTDLTWSENVNLDGLAARGRLSLFEGVRFVWAGGAFPVFTTDLAFPAERTDKFKSLDKWLLAAQLGATWQPSIDFLAKLSVGWFDFRHVQGRVSAPCDTNLKGFACDTDPSRPSFAQKGNTYMAIRTPSAKALQAEATGLVPRYQYFGLASRFEELVLTAQLDATLGESLRVLLDAEAVRNLGFSRRAISAVALNNLDQCDANGNCARFAGGQDGWLTKLTLATLNQEVLGSWNVSVGYRVLSSDAVVDAFTDSDFGLGGTNLKGYVIGAGVAIGDNVWAGLRWFSADSVVGPTYQVDVLQLDCSARF
jgi:hypothetical protein